MAPLENKVRNIYLEKLSRYNSLFNVGLTALYKFKKELDNNQIHYRNGQFYHNYRNIRNVLWNSDKKVHNKFKKLREELDELESCFRNCKANLNNFYYTGHIKLFIRAFNDLQTAHGRRVSTKNIVTNYEFTKIRYFSRDKFCLISRKKRINKTRDLLLSSLNLYTEFDTLRPKFFTISPKNIDVKDFTNETFKKFGAAVFKTFRRRLSIKGANNVNIAKYEQRLKTAFDEGKLTEKQYHYNLTDLHGVFQNELNDRPMLSDYFKGYFGVPEIKENSETKTVNLHIHSVVLTENDFDKSYVSKFYIEEVVKETFEKYGPDCMKGSNIVDIRDKTRKGESNAQAAVNYILVDYFLKGVDIQTESFYEQVLLETDGIRFERSGGLLSAKNLKQNAVIYATKSGLDDLSMYDLKDYTSNLNRLFIKELSIGGKTRFDGSYYKEPYQLDISKYVELRQKTERVHDQALDLLFNKFECFGQTYRLPNETYLDIEESMFGKTSLRCKFYTNPENNKLSWDSLQDEEFETDISDSSFIEKALISIGHQEKRTDFIMHAEKYAQNEVNIICSEFEIENSSYDNDFYSKPEVDNFPIYEDLYSNFIEQEMFSIGKMPKFKLERVF